MDKITSFAGALIADESGVTAIEYGLLAALIAVAIITGISATGVSISAIYTFWTTEVITALAGAL